MTLVEVQALDDQDPIAHLRSEFKLPRDTIYLDGNSLGALSAASRERINEVLEIEWGNGLISSWNDCDWIGYPQRIGDRIAPLIGASPGEVLCCDSISINIFKVLSHARALRPERRVILSTRDNFPTDLYMVQGFSELLNGEIELRLVDEHELEDAIDESVALVMLSQVNFRTGALFDMRKISKHAHQKECLIMWDLAHSAGALPVSLNECSVDYAVGCTYKYLNGGPGAPAFLFVAKALQTKASQKLFGWMGHARGFDFSPDYSPAGDIRQFSVGTPSILAMAAVDGALSVFAKTSIEALRSKSISLSTLFERLLNTKPALTELQAIHPPEPHLRGSQLTYAHPDAYAICQALIANGVVPDFRAPNYIRFGFAPLYLNHRDIESAINSLERIMKSKSYQSPEYQTRQKVT